jgi:hypothetical protein
MAFYNNVLSVLVLLPLCWFNGGLAAVRSDNAVHRPAFLVAASASAALAFGISYFSLWFHSTTTATVYSLVGSLNKVPLAVLGLVVFKTPATPLNLASVAIGLVAASMRAAFSKLSRPHRCCHRRLTPILPVRPGHAPHTPRCRPAVHGGPPGRGG